ncbi:hypothetical protein L1765_15500 [Microaerobacter geothermalis]|uniref:hypothetical protein n=1 Tax=Microaerobacter geothermalis TaxID=674972 RepID=UPI001F1B829C|nr:hypothetical protein [Microaerobacter geothermalis]MCF6095361.1 hypothetical protein [Microaerobacter geothermalis]
MLKKKFLIGFLTGSIAWFSIIPGLSSSTLASGEISAQAVKIGTSDTTQPLNNIVQPQGIKSTIVNIAVNTVASALRYGGPALEYIVGFLDKKAAASLSKNANKIADKLDYIAEIPDLTSNMVKTYVYNFLRNDLKISGGTALQIADAIKAVIDWLIF